MTSGNRYTKHDIGHVDDVIEVAGHLLGAEDEQPLLEKLAPYEVFVLLLAILLHDAGNARGREKHELEPRRILDSLGTVVPLASPEKRLIASVAAAHGGYGPSGEKDTIGTVIVDQVTQFGAIKVHGRRLAALLRLADELSERPSRADQQALQEPYDSPSSVVHNLYCLLINTHIDPQGQTVSLSFDVDRKELSRKYTLGEGDAAVQVYLVDYIAMRLDKCELERQYCNRFLTGLVSYQRLRVRLRIYDETTSNTHPIDEITLELADVGYPTQTNKVVKLRPAFSGVVLENKHCPRPDQEGGN